MEDLRTRRLLLRRFVPDDAPFVLELLNEPSFHRHIGDKGVRTLDDARDYLRGGPMEMYARHGLGLLLVGRVDDGSSAAADDPAGGFRRVRPLEPVGMCGLLQRPDFDAPDLGFAFLERHQRRGFGLESSVAVLDDARRRMNLGRVLAVTSRDNTGSIALLERLGFRFERDVRFGEEAAADEGRLFALDLARKATVESPESPE